MTASFTTLSMGCQAARSGPASGSVVRRTSVSWERRRGRVSTGTRLSSLHLQTHMCLVIQMKGLLEKYEIRNVWA